MSAITAKASRKMKKYAVLTREPRCFLGSFDFSWEQRKLSEIADKVTEKNSGLQYVETFTNSAEFGIISQRDFFDHDIAKLSSLDGYYIVKNEDFVYNPRISTSAPVGPINRNKLGRTGVMSPLYTVFRPHDVDTTYLEHFFKCAYWHSFMNFNGDSGARSDRFSIKNDVFFQMPIPLPHIDEQRKIGELLTCLDHLITLHQRKCVFLFGLFQASISMIFTASTFSWEQRKLGDISEIKTGPFGSTLHADDYVSDGTPIITTEHFKTGALPRSKNGLPQVSDSDYKRLTAYTLDDGDIVFSRVGSVDINALITPFQSNWLFSGRVLRVRPQTDISSKFLHTRLETESIKTDIRTRAVGQTMPSINTEILKITPLVLPSSAAEQEQIGSYFAALDNLITLHQRQLFFIQPRIFL